MPRRRALLRSMAAGMVVALSGCASGDTGADETPTSTATSASSPTETPTRTIATATTTATQQTATRTPTPTGTPYRSPPPTATLAAADGDAEDSFGTATSLHDGITVLGAAGDEDPNGAGAAYVFERANGKWRQRAKLAPSDGEFGDDFGYGVDYADGRILVEASGGTNEAGRNAGAAYVFERSSDGWTHRKKLFVDDGGGTDDGFGESLALDGEHLLVGAPEADEPNGSGSGAAYVFSVA